MKSWPSWPLKWSNWWKIQSSPKKWMQGWKKSNTLALSLIQGRSLLERVSQCQTTLEMLPCTTDGSVRVGRCPTAPTRIHLHRRLLFHRRPRPFRALKLTRRKNLLIRKGGCSKRPPLARCSASQSYWTNNLQPFQMITRCKMTLAG